MITQTPQWLHVFVDVRADVAEASATFWSAALGWELGEQWPGHPEFRSFEPLAGDAYVHQQVGDHGPRIHFDLEVADEAEMQQLVDSAPRWSARARVGTQWPHRAGSRSV